MPGTKDGAAEDVRAGMELLDERGPDGWERRIDLQRLNISSCEECVCGQLYGNYADALPKLGINSGRGYGFVMSNRASTRELQVEWERAIAERRRGTPGAPGDTVESLAPLRESELVGV